MTRPARYRLEALPIEAVTAREWDPTQLRQGFATGAGQLGPLLNTTTTTDTP